MLLVGDGQQGSGQDVDISPRTGSCRQRGPVQEPLLRPGAVGAAAGSRSLGIRTQVRLALIIRHKRCVNLSLFCSYS